MPKNDLSVLGWMWVAFISAVAVLIVMMANFRFQENLLKAELISHSAPSSGIENVCVCSICGVKSLAYCVHCGTPMKWDEMSKYFVCPICKSTGTPLCPQCNVAMSGVKTMKSNSNVIVNGAPIPVY